MLILHERSGHRSVSDCQNHGYKINDSKIHMYAITSTLATRETKISNTVDSYHSETRSEHTKGEKERLL